MTNSRPLTSSQEGFPASLFPSLESSGERQTSDGSGLTSRESFAYYDPDMRWWKTYQASFIEELTEFSETWPRSGTMRNGLLYRPESSARLTSESESLSLPTTGRNEYKGSSVKRYRGSPHFRGAKMSEGLRICEADPIYLNPSFAEVVMGFPIGWTVLQDLETQ